MVGHQLSTLRLDRKYLTPSYAKCSHSNISRGCNGFFLGSFIAMMTIQYINPKPCTRSWSQSRTFAGASMFISGFWVDLSSDARARQQTLFLGLFSPVSVVWLVVTSPRRSNDHLIMILDRKGFVFLYCGCWGVLIGFYAVFNQRLIRDDLISFPKFGFVCQLIVCWNAGLNKEVSQLKMILLS